MILEACDREQGYHVVAKRPKSEITEPAPAVSPAQDQDIATRMLSYLVEHLLSEHRAADTHLAKLNAAEALIHNWDKLLEQQRGIVTAYLQRVAANDVRATDAERVRAASLGLKCPRT